MCSQNDKATWSILRFNHRTFTAQLASMQRNKQVAAIPEKYIYIVIAVIMATENKRDNPAIRLQNHRKGSFCKLATP